MIKKSSYHEIVDKILDQFIMNVERRHKLLGSGASFDVILKDCEKEVGRYLFGIKCDDKKFIIYLRAILKYIKNMNKIYDLLVEQILSASKLKWIVYELKDYENLNKIVCRINSGIIGLEDAIKYITTKHCRSLDLIS